LIRRNRVKVFFHYCPSRFSNCYVLGTDSPGEEGPGEAVIIDPGSMDEVLLDFIEGNEYVLRGVLITHDHLSHVQGLRTLMRIYKPEIFAVNQTVLDHKTVLIRDGDILNIGRFQVEVISVPGHSSDSVVFKIEHMLFTGDVLTAGLVGSTASSYGAAVQMTALRNRILSLPGDFTILPGHGPPASLEGERRFNAGIQMFDQRKTQRPSFRGDIFE
jgi:glyoxylase-like metal-dependent hydrolase (beta-lactamase superfamily II)